MPYAPSVLITAHALFLRDLLKLLATCDTDTHAHDTNDDDFSLSLLFLYAFLWHYLRLLEIGNNARPIHHPIRVISVYCK